MAALNLINSIHHHLVLVFNTEISILIRSFLVFPCSLFTHIYIDSEKRSDSEKSTPADFPSFKLDRLNETPITGFSLQFIPPDISSCGFEYVFVLPSLWWHLIFPSPLFETVPSSAHISFRLLSRITHASRLDFDSITISAFSDVNFNQ